MTKGPAGVTSRICDYGNCAFAAAACSSEDGATLGDAEETESPATTPAATPTSPSSDSDDTSTVLGLTRPLDELDDRLAWAVRERPGPTALLEHVLRHRGRPQARATHRPQRPEGAQTLEAFDFDFDFDFQPTLDLRIE